MRRFFAYGLTIALLVACSTQEKDFQTPVQEDVIYYATFEQPAEEGTRVYANEDLLLRWTADDRVSIFGKNTYNQQYQFLGETGDNSGGFSKVDVAEYVTGNPISHTVSVYPYQASTKITEDEVLTVTLPAEQHYAENTFGLGANTMVSVSEDNFLQYKNVGGYLMLKLYGDGVSVSSITLKGNNGEKLAGNATVAMPVDGLPSVEMATDASREITLTCETPVQLGATAEEATQFWLVIPPVTFSKGFTVTVSGDGGVFEKNTDKTLAIERNRLSTMASIEVELVPTHPRNVIYYTTSDGAKVIPFFPDFVGTFGANILSNEYVNGLGVITFDGDVTSFGNQAFDGCSNLTSIMIPESVTIIGGYAFNACSSLASITIPDSVMSIGDGAFDRCHSLMSFGGKYSTPDGLFLIDSGEIIAVASGAMNGVVTIPDSVTSIGNSAFSNCWSLTGIMIPDSVTSIGNFAFSNCWSLTGIIIPESVTSIEFGVFEMCFGLTSITIPASVTSIGNGAFIDCTSLINISIPESVTSIGKSAFYDCSGLTSITLKPIVPPTGERCMFDETNDAPIYVPAESVDAYKSSQFWSDYANRIQPLAPLPEAVDLGLSVKWASLNLGATKPEEYGDYYAWGETEPYYSSLDPLIWKEGKEDGYYWPSYKWCMGSKNTLTKYCSDSSFGYNGFTDDKTVLDLEDDAAHGNLGGSWRMPTDEEWTELREKCTWTWTTQNGVNGYLVTGPNGNSIFLPAAGLRDNANLDYVGSFGYSWSSSLYTGSPDIAWYENFNSGLVYRNKYYRFLGFSVRPVYAE